MGLDSTSLRYHFHLKKSGIDFRKVALLGRQLFYGVTQNDLISTASKFGMDMSHSDADHILNSNHGYTEPFYEWLGAEQVESFDASDYESATHIWNMNQVLPDMFRSNYDFVFDGGTLEHVFNYPSALREAMTMVKLGGVFLSVTPSDSYLGHGLYQFSPDLAFEVMKPSNGYELIDVHLIEERPNPIFFKVKPPNPERGRAIASSHLPTQLCWAGKRVGNIPSQLNVNQPDYSSDWIHHGITGAKTKGIKSLILKLLSPFSSRIRISIIRVSRNIIGIVAGNSFWDRNWLEKSDII